MYPDAWRKEVEVSLCRPKVASRIRDAVSSADRSERVRARRESSKRVKRRRGSQCGNSSRTRELPTNTRRRGQRPSRRPRQVAASAPTARAVRGSDIDEVEPPGRSRNGRLRAAVTGGPRRYEALPESVAAGCIARLGRLVLGHSMRHSDGSRDWRPPRCIPRSRGAASRNREFGLAPSEAREGPAASTVTRLLAACHLRLARIASDAPRSILRRRGGDPRRITSLEPHGGDPRYTRWVANHYRERSFRCRE
jgi:hypothetical protein